MVLFLFLFGLFWLFFVLVEDILSFAFSSVLQQLEISWPTMPRARSALKQKNKKQNKTKNYFTSSDPHHDMLGGGCQVRVVIENMMGRMENLRTLISGFLGYSETSEMGFGHDVPFLN